MTEGPFLILTTVLAALVLLLSARLWARVTQCEELEAELADAKRTIKGMEDEYNERHCQP